MPHEEITAKIAAHRRTAYIPNVEKGDGPAGGSKFSGVPYLAAGESWPACGNCGRPMQLFVQLAADELPAEARERIGAGKLLQFFLLHERRSALRIRSGGVPAARAEHAGAHRVRRTRG